MKNSRRANHAPNINQAIGLLMEKKPSKPTSRSGDIEGWSAASWIDRDSASPVFDELILMI